MPWSPARANTSSLASGPPIESASRSWLDGRAVVHRRRGGRRGRRLVDGGASRARGVECEPEGQPEPERDHRDVLGHVLDEPADPEVAGPRENVVAEPVRVRLMAQDDPS